MEKKKIFFLIGSLSNGGAQRVISILANNLDKEKYCVKIITLQEKGGYSKEINSDIELLNLNIKSNIKFLYKGSFKILKILWNEKPEILLVTITLTNILFAPFVLLKPKKTKIIARETSILKIIFKEKKYPKFLKNVISFLYKRYNCLIVQSNDMEKDIKNFLKIKNKIYKINNPIDYELIQEKLKNKKIYFEKNNSDIKNFIAIGRLNYQKGFDLLIESLTLLENLNYKLRILGKGEEMENLKKLVKKFNLEEKVDFLGHIENPYVYLKSSDLLIVTSRFEGFPNAVLEANACGVPVFAFECEGGLNEIIVSKENGELIKNFSKFDLSKMLDKFLKNEKKYDKNIIIKNILDKYSKEKIVKEYESLFESII
ncbi:MAG: glycosyltransferase [Cetobacterium sp.]